MCPDEKFGLYLLGNRQEERWRGLDQGWQPQGLHPLRLHTEGDPEGRGLEGQEASLRGCLANSVEAIAARCGYTPCSSREGSQPNSGRTIRQTNLGLCIQALTGVLPANLWEDRLKAENLFPSRREGRKQPVGWGWGDRKSSGLVRVQNEDKWAVGSREYILSLEHLPLHQGPAQACRAGAALLCLCWLCSRCHGNGAISHVCRCCTEAL